MNLRCVLAASLLAGPAFASFRCPARGGAAWREYRTAHFLIDTDGSANDGRSLVRQFEHIHALLLQALVGEQVEIPGHLRVLVFSDPGDFREIVGEGASGIYTRGFLGEPTIVLPLRVLVDDPEGIAHELAHHLSYFLFPVQPHWFTEGLAEWVQTVAARPADKAVSRIGSHIAHGANALSGSMAGSIPVNLVSWLGYDARPMPAAELFAWDGSETASSAGRGHLWSWVLYHWLWNERSKAFADYQKRLADGGDPQAAWRAAFPEFDPANKEAMAKLDDALDRYRRDGRFAFFKVEAQGNERFTEAEVSSSDLHLWMLGIRSNWPKEDDRRKAMRQGSIDEAAAEDPGSPIALSMRMGKVADVAPLRAAVQARPADWRGWLALGQKTQSKEAEEALRKAVQLDGESSFAQNTLAWFLVESGRAHEALPFANRALDLAPWDANIVDTLAEVAAQLGKCKEALQLEKRAVATSAKLRERQAEIEKRCAAK